MIVIKELNKSYGSKKVLENINLSLDGNKIYGFVGENGSGKTTLFNCIAGMEKFDGAISSGFTSLKNNLGFLQTDPYFLARITGREYLQLLCNARNLPAIDFNTQNLFDLPLETYTTSYSTGMKKKLALTGILLQKNQVYILDEPFNGVDLNGNLMIKQIILKLKKLHKTVILSSHIFSTLNDVCDIIFLIKNGKILKEVSKEGFADLEKEMTDFAVSGRVDKMELS